MKGKRFAVLGDIHGNWEALSAVLADAAGQGVTAYACVGDVVGYNADPARCLERILDLAAVTVRGNHDHYCSHDECLEDLQPLAANVIDWTRRQLSSEQTTCLRDLKLHAMTAGFGLVHSTLDVPEKWAYVYDTLDAAAHFNYQTVSVCFYGHTHMPMLFEKHERVRRALYTRVKLTVGTKYFINVGSVGQPRDGDPRASYVVYSPSERLVELRRVAYDIEKAQEKIRRVGLPERLALRLALGR